MKGLLPRKDRNRNVAVNLVDNRAYKIDVRSHKDKVKEIQRSVESYAGAEILLISEDIIKYASNVSVVNIQEYFDDRGISWRKLQRLRATYSLLDEAVECAESIVATRLTKIPFNKVMLVKHVHFMLDKSIGGRWKDNNVIVNINNESIFDSMQTAPIIQVVPSDKRKMERAREALGLTNKSLVDSDDMEPNLEEGVGTE